jgi:hypothetical protein
MATTFGTQSTKVLSSTKSTPGVGFVHGSVRNFSEQVAYTAQASGDIVVVGFVPKGAIFLYATIETDTTTSTATIALSSVTVNSAGTASVASAGKYAAAAAYTTVDTPVVVGKTAASGVALAADELIGAVVGTAALPGSGNLKINIFYAFN